MSRQTLTDRLLQAEEFHRQAVSGDILKSRVVGLDWISDASGRRHRSLQWEIYTRPESARSTNWLVVHPTRDLAITFAGLRMAPESEILKFAKAWGNLGVCALHPDRPAFHLNHECLPIAKADLETPGHFVGDYVRGFEPMRFWRRYAWRIHAILELGRALANADFGKRWMWRILYPSSPQVAVFSGQSKRENLTLARYNFSMKLKELYSQCGIEECLDWELETTTGHGRWVWRTRPTKPFNLVAVLAMQTGRILCGGNQTWRCDSCGRDYLRPGKRPRAGGQNFCPECRNAGEPLRAANAARKRRMQLARGLLLEGRSVEHVAEAVGSRAATIERLATTLDLTGGANGKA